jgi:hypothetical protein
MNDNPVIDYIQLGIEYCEQGITVSYLVILL